MNIQRRTLLAVGLAPLALVALALAVASCSSDDNPAPSAFPGADASGDTTLFVNPEGDSSPTGCTSDASTCNSCVAPETDPYNACSEATGGCVPFDNARVPKGPNGEIPQVP